jgi:hypothetical protein
VTNDASAPPQWEQPPTPPPARRKPKWYASPLFWTLTLVGLIGLLVATVLIAGPVQRRTASAPQTTTVAPAATTPITEPPSSAPDVTEPPQTGPEVLKVGQTLSVRQSADTSGYSDPAQGSADITVTKVEAATREPVEFGSKPERGWFVVVHVKAVGTGGGLDVNPFDFYVKSPNGFHAEDSTYSDAWGPTFDSATLNKGEHVSGTLIYDVPSRHGQLVYAPNLDGEAIGIWKF